MTDTDKLNEAIEMSGLKLIFIADKMGLSAYGLSKKINNITEFKASEIAKIAEILSLQVSERDAIFFGMERD